MIASQSARDIDDALKLYRLAQGTDAEDDAYSHLQAVVERAKQQDACCGGRCRFCPVWRVP